jgi:hypothetical protein
MSQSVGGVPISCACLTEVFGLTWQVRSVQCGRVCTCLNAQRPHSFHCPFHTPTHVRYGRFCYLATLNCGVLTVSAHCFCYIKHIRLVSVMLFCTVNVLWSARFILRVANTVKSEVSYCIKYFPTVGREQWRCKKLIKIRSVPVKSALCCLPWLDKNTFKLHTLFIYRRKWDLWIMTVRL